MNSDPLANGLLDRFLRYVQIDTQSDEHSPSSPSTLKQLDLSRLLEQECLELQLADVSRDERGIVMATVPATVAHAAPTVVWNSHVDTSPEYSGTQVKPIVHRHYDGGEIVLPGDPQQVLRPSQFPALTECVGLTLITTDGSTLLGADDKAGIAEIMTAAAQLQANPQIPHGPIRLCFTVDEEIGRGIEGLDFKKLGGVCGYTLDSGGVGRIDIETFSANVAVITVQGVNTHPSVGKDVMVNAIKILSRFLTLLPTDTLCPEKTAGRDGFLHPYRIEGGVAEATARIILRDFDTNQLGVQAELLRRIALQLEADEPRCRVIVDVRKQYRNMREGLIKEPRSVDKAVQAVRAVGLEPILDIIRGGTDGALMTEAGLPTPNLSSGQQNPHSPLEWTCLEHMQKAVDVLIQLAIAWGQETA